MAKDPVFISHASENKDIAEQMCEILEARGIECRYSGRIPAGTEWDRWITEEIKLCRVVIVIVSKDANQSDYVQSEVHIAYQKKKTLVPFVIEETEMDGNLSIHLGRRQQIKALDVDKEEKLGELAHVLLARSRRTKPKPKVPLPPPPEPTEPIIDGKGKPTGLRDFRNPYEFDVAADDRTFKGRELEILELFDCIESNTHAAVFGLQRMGKTSLVEEGLHERILETPELRDAVLMCSVNLQEIGDSEVKYRDLMRAILDNVVKSLVDAGMGQKAGDLHAAIDDVVSPRDYYRGDRSEIFQRFATVVRGIAHQSQRRILLFIDEFSEVRKVIERNKGVLRKNPSRTRNLLPHDMFIDVPFIHQLGSLLKDRSLKEVFTLIVAVRPFMAEFDQQEELQLLKLMRPITVYYLSENAARSLIIEPVEGFVSYDAEAVSYLWRVTRGHPYLLQFILKMLIDETIREKRDHIGLNDVLSIESRMISDGPAFDAQFGVLISDYSVDEVTDRTEAELGKGTLAIVSKYGDEQPGGWVTEGQIVKELMSHYMPEGKAYSLLSQLSRTRILEEENCGGTLCYRMYVPLLRKRFVKQNLYLKYFRKSDSAHARSRRGSRNR